MAMKDLIGLASIEGENNRRTREEEICRFDLDVVVTTVLSKIGGIFTLKEKEQL